MCPSLVEIRSADPASSSERLQSVRRQNTGESEIKRQNKEESKNKNSSGDEIANVLVNDDIAHT